MSKYQLRIALIVVCATAFGGLYVSLVGEQGRQTELAGPASNQVGPNVSGAAYSPLAVASSSALDRSIPRTLTARHVSVSVDRQQFLRLASSSSPRDAYEAYAMLARCNQARDFDREWRDTPQSQRSESLTGLRQALGEDHTKRACGDLTTADLGPASRLALLERAAEAGLPQAALWLSAEGPFGDPASLRTRPDDPAVSDWQNKVAKLIVLAADRGDVVSTMSLAEQYATGGGVMQEQDDRKALVYAAGYRKLYELQQGRAVTLTQIRELEQRLPADEAAKAIAEGEAFAKRAFKNWKEANEGGTK